VRKLRLGLFADAPLQPRWIVEAFDKVARSDFAEIALISVGGGRAPVPLLWRVIPGTRTRSTSAPSVRRAATPT